MLEEFAGQVAATNVAESIASVFDNYVNFIVSEPNLFSLGMPTAYSLLNSANTSDQALDEAVDQIVSGLFNVCATMGVVPIIRAPKDGEWPSTFAHIKTALTIFNQAPLA